LQDGAEAQEILRLRILPDGAGYPFRGEIALLGMERQQPHQMQGIRMIGIRREGLLAVKLSVEISLGAQMTHACFAEHRGSAGAVCNRLGFLDRGPALVTVHSAHSAWVGVEQSPPLATSAVLGGLGQAALVLATMSRL
jgi:hypothetical protein